MTEKEGIKSEKAGIPAESSGRSGLVPKDEVQGTDEKIEYVTLGYVNVSREISVKDIVKVFPGGAYRRYLRIDQRLGTNPKTGRGKWSHIYLHDLDAVNSLTEALNQFLNGSFSYNVGERPVFRENPEAVRRLEELGVHVTPS